MDPARRITADDVAHHAHCERLPFLWHSHPSLAGGPDAYGAHLRERWREHLRRVVDATPGVVRLVPGSTDLDALARATTEAMTAGAPAIHPVALVDEVGGRVSAPPLLVREADLYSPREVTLSASVQRPEHVERLRFHAEVLGQVTGRRPERGSVVLGDGTMASVAVPGPANLGTVAERVRAHRDQGRSGEPWPEVAYGSSKCGRCAFREPCVRRFSAERDVSLVYDVNATAWRALRARGLRRHDDLALASPESLGKVKGLARGRLPRAQAQARALTTGERRLLAPAELPRVAMFLDLEGDPDADVDYLWGVLDGARYRALFADGPDGDRRVFEEFLAACARAFERDPGARIVHYGTYEALRLRRYAVRHGGPPRLLEAVSGALFDLHREVRRVLVVPTLSYGLKAVAQSLGFRWRIADSNASWSIVRYRDWLRTQDPAIRAEIEQYNEDDVRATEHVFRSLAEGAP